MIFIGSDHAGFLLKELIKVFLREQGIPYEDVGTHSLNLVDYPDYTFAVAQKVATGSPEDIGIVICDTGIGACIAANKVKNVRAAIGYSEYLAQRARNDNDANVLCLGARTTDHDLAIRVIETFINTPFSLADRNLRKISKIKAQEEHL